MGLPQFTIRRLMIAVAIVAFVLVLYKKFTAPIPLPRYMGYKKSEIPNINQSVRPSNDAPNPTEPK